MKKTIIVLVVLLALGFVGWYLFGANVAVAPTGEALTPSANGVTYDNATADLITVDLPFPKAVVSHQFTARGKARGTWYFEASFPVHVFDKDGNELVSGPAQAEGEWMTEEFVPFKIDITIPPAYEGDATIVFMKDNPSGLPEKEANISFPITISD